MAHRSVLSARARRAEARAAAIRLLLLDVDGVLTDGTVLLHPDGSESKRFHIKDGAGLVWAQGAGLAVGWLSSRPSLVTERRAAELGVKILVQTPQPKLNTYEHILRKQHLKDEQIAYMGDDLLDLPVLARVGISAAPADAVAAVRDRVDYVTEARGGDGAVREVVEWLLRAQGRWEQLLSGWTGEGSR